MIEATLRVVVDAVKDGAEVRLNGFCSFKVQDWPKREGRNPATGEAMTLAPGRKLAVSPQDAKGRAERLAPPSLAIGAMLP